jgi:hypothetical protein
LQIKSFITKANKDPNGHFAFLPKHPKQYERSWANKLSKEEILIWDWNLKYVILTNLGRRGSQYIFKNLASYIWNDTIQAISFTTNFKCWISNRNRVQLRVAEACKEIKYGEEVKSS